MAFTLRPFKPADLERVRDINRRCLPENYSTYFFTNLYERFPETFIVAEKNGEVVGYIMCRVEKGMSDFRLMRMARKGHVISIAVLPEHRRQGIGYALIQESMRAMALYRAKECFLEVRVSNTPAVDLYRKMGFEVTRTMSNYYADGEAAYRMSKELPFEAS